MPEIIRWGIIGTGAIARKFASALQTLPDARLTAVGSRSASTAEIFGAQFQVPNRHASYQALASDPEVDVVYVATPHSCHAENALAALGAGKPVLIEKPFTLNAAEAEKVIAAARSTKTLAMEAMWTRFLPLYVELRKLVSQDVIGDVRILRADFGVATTPQKRSRLFDPALGGGALLDVGVYPVSLASMFFGRPREVTGAAHLGATGVDEYGSLLLKYGGGQMALISCAITVSTPLEVVLMGAAGHIRIHAPFWKANALTRAREGGNEETLHFPYDGNGYQYEAMEFMNCLRMGKQESALMPLDETLSILQTLDTLRRQWGLKYPTEA